MSINLLVFHLFQFPVKVFCFVFPGVLLDPGAGGRGGDHQLELELSGQVAGGQRPALQRQPVMLHVPPDLGEILEDDRQPPEVNTVRGQPLLEDPDIEAEIEALGEHAIPLNSKELNTRVDHGIILKTLRVLEEELNLSRGHLTSHQINKVILYILQLCHDLYHPPLSQDPFLLLRMIPHVPDLPHESG